VSDPPDRPAHHDDVNLQLEFVLDACMLSVGSPALSRRAAMTSLAVDFRFALRFSVIVFLLAVTVHEAADKGQPAKRYPQLWGKLGGPPHSKRQ